MLKKERTRELLIGGVINKSNLKIGFLNNGRFCAPEEFLPDLPGALFGDYGYLGRLDLWIGVPDGPWASEVWDPQSQTYITMGPSVSGTIYEPLPTDTDWSTINATSGALYTPDVLYSDIYKPSELFDFILAPANELKQTWPRNTLTGLREWPGKWKKDPLTGKPMEGEFLGDQQIFLSFDDKTYADQLVPEEVAYGGFPPQRGYSIGAEVLANVIGFQEAYISKMAIFDLQIINTSQWDYHDVYLGIYYESDNPWYWLREGRPRYYGLKTGYIKNEYNPKTDEVILYNLSYNYNVEGYADDDPNCFGVQLLKTPAAMNDQFDNDGDGIIDEPDGEELGLTGWHFFPFYGIYDYGNREKLQYQILKGDTTGLSRFNLIDNNCFYKDADGNLDPNFDSPDGIKYWRFGEIWLIYNVLSCGPLTWHSSDTLNFVFGILLADDFEKLKGSAQIARKIVQSDYRRSEGPSPPNVTAVPQNGKVTLYWDRSAETSEDFITGYQDFEGYKIYRTTSDPINNEWGERIIDHQGKQINFMPVASCDLDNKISGYEPVYPFQYLGDDTGLFHTWTDSSVTNGVTYWYSVCSYDHGIVDDENLNPSHFPPSPLKECPKGTDPDNSQNLVKVIPGVQAYDHEVAHAELETLSDVSGNGPITPYIIDPYQVTGHDYLIMFEDTTFGYAVYNLYDETDGTMLFEKVASTNGEEGLIFDGIQLSIQRYDDMDVLNEKTFWFKYETGELSNCTWTILGGKLTWDPYPYEYDIRFTDKMDTSIFLKKTAPFEIWNTILNQKALWDIYFNYAGTDTTDSLKNTWSSGDMIYIWDEFNEENKFTLRITITERSIYTYQGLVNNPPQPGDAAHIALKRPFITGDQFRIRTSALKKKQIGQADLSDIKVVPNPYVVGADWELGKDDSRIQFIHLPSECSIHIYTLAGDKVRTLHHTNPNTDYEFWDLLNFSNLKASYGLYVYVVETPDGKAMTGKFVILR
ncbi:MAG: hypothetical protein ACOY90_14370 [Candidatus Zhuqueibacterota bacterium]